jgi:cell division protein FtsL
MTLGGAFPAILGVVILGLVAAGIAAAGTLLIYARAQALELDRKVRLLEAAVSAREQVSDQLARLQAEKAKGARPWLPR